MRGYLPVGALSGPLFFPPACPFVCTTITTFLPVPAAFDTA
jgi:hypothetical protein